MAIIDMTHVNCIYIDICGNRIDLSGAVPQSVLTFLSSVMPLLESDAFRCLRMVYDDYELNIRYCLTGEHDYKLYLTTRPSKLVL